MFWNSRRAMWLALIELVASAGCDENRPDEQTTTIAAVTDPDDCGGGTVGWPADPDNGVWRTGIPDAPAPGTYTVPPVQLAGRIDGTASVSQGVGSYQIPIVVAPGRVGMQPRLALQYTSSAQNDVAGVGWSLSGGSRIHRCPRRQGQDGEVLPVSYTTSDRLCLDGQRLVVVAGTYGDTGAEYRTEINTFARVKQLGRLDDATTCFTAEGKDGITTTYGGCNDPSAAQILPGATAPWSWSAQKMVDPRGNDIQFVYTVIDDQHLLQRIRYTGHPTVAATRSVELTYEARPDIEIAYQSQTPLRSVQRLKAITSMFGALVVRRYELDYTTSAATRRSLLERVRTCSAFACTSANSLPATTFSYQQLSPSFVTEQLPTSDPERERYKLLADYDGDGRRDRLHYTTREAWGGPWTAAILELSGGVNVDVLSSSWTATFDRGDESFPTETDGDFDNDGRADLEGTSNGHFAIGSWNSSTRRIDVKESNLVVTGTVIDRADFDADGRTDLLIKDGNDLTVQFQCAATTLSFCRSAVLPPLDGACETLTQLADLDGNGMPDLLIRGIEPTPQGCSASARILFVSRSTTGLATNSQQVSTIGGPSGNLVHTQLADITGDGLPDIVLSSGLTAWINEGGSHRVSSSTRFRQASIVGPSPSVPFRLVDSVMFADIDQDGRAELLYPAELTPISLSEGNWCATPDPPGTPDPLEYCSGTSMDFDLAGAPRDLDYSSYRWNAIDIDLDRTGGLVSTWRTTDLVAPIRRKIVEDHDGDGLEDVRYFVASKYGEGPTGVGEVGRSTGLTNGAYVAHQRGPASDRLTRIIDGLGTETHLAYAPLSGRGDPACLSATQPFYRANYATIAPDGIYSLFTSSMHVVSRMETSNGIGGFNGTCYRYEDAWMDRQGRGFLTFGTTIDVQDVPGDAANNLRVTRRHEHVWPVSGRIVEEKTDLASDPVTAAPLSRTTTSMLWACASSVCFARPSQRVVATHDPATRAQLSTQTTDYTWDPSDLTYGNMSSQRTTVVDATHSQRTIAEFKYDYTDVASWWIDRLASKVETFEGIVSPPAATGPTQLVTTSFQYLANRLVAWERAQPGDPTMARSTQTTYDTFGNPITKHVDAANAASRETSAVFAGDGYFATNRKDAAGHKTDIVTDARFGVPMQITDPNNLLTTFAYDLFGRRTQMDGPATQPVDERLLACTAATCPPLAVVSELVMQPGAPTRTRYLDVLGRPVRESVTGFANAGDVHVLYEYDARGHEVAKSMPTADLAHVYSTRYGNFDPLGRPGIQRRERVGAPPIDITYRHVGLDTFIKLPGITNELARRYDSQQRLLQSTDGLGVTTRYRYDARGKLATLTDVRGNEIRVTYDALQRPVTVVHPDGGTRTTSYDGFGLVRSETDSNGATIATTYDALDRPISRTINGSPEAKWGYDRKFVGAIDYERGGSEGMTRYCRGFDYESAGQVRQSVVFTDGLALSTDYAVDGRYGRVKGIRYPSRRALAIGYDDTGRQSSERNPVTGTLYRNTTMMAPDGQVRRETFGNGLVGDYFVDAASSSATRLWVHKAASEPSAPPLQDLNYTYDQPYAMLSKQLNVVTNVAETFTYDEVMRLRTATRSWPSSASVTLGHSYDVLGNLIVKSDYSAQTIYGNGTRANTAHAGPHAILSFTRPSGQTVADFQYDANGNQTRGDGRLLAYSAFDKPLTIISGAVTMGFAYSPSLELYKRTVGTKTTYVIDRMHERIVDGVNVTERDYVGKTVFTKLPNGTQVVRYLHPDRLGSTDTFSDASGNRIEAHGYDPFGNPRDAQWVSVARLASAATERGFTGHTQLDDVDLTHMGGRVYDYRLGRFLSIDRFVTEPSDGQTLNAYTYVRNNPVMRIDPTGYADEEDKHIIKPEEIERVSVTKEMTTGSHIVRVTKVTIDLKDKTSITVTPEQARKMSALYQIAVKPDPNGPANSWVPVRDVKRDAPVKVSHEPFGLCPDCYLQMSKQTQQMINDVAATRLLEQMGEANKQRAERLHRTFARREEAEKAKEEPSAVHQVGVLIIVTPHIGWIAHQGMRLLEGWEEYVRPPPHSTPAQDMWSAVKILHSFAVPLVGGLVLTLGSEYDHLLYMFSFGMLDAKEYTH